MLLYSLNQLDYENQLIKYFTVHSSDVLFVSDLRAFINSVL